LRKKVLKMSSLNCEPEFIALFLCFGFIVGLFVSLLFIRVENQTEYSVELRRIRYNLGLIKTKLDIMDGYQSINSEND